MLKDFVWECLGVIGEQIQGRTSAREKNKVESIILASLN